MEVTTSRQESMFSFPLDHSAAPLQLAQLQGISSKMLLEFSVSNTGNIISFLAWMEDMFSEAPFHVFGQLKLFKRRRVFPMFLEAPKISRIKFQ